MSSDPHPCSTDQDRLVCEMLPHQGVAGTMRSRNRTNGDETRQTSDRGMPKSARFILTGLAMVVAFGCANEPPPSDPALYRDCDMLVLVVDALRGDRLGCTGAPHDVSPNIDALAADGVLFERAIAQSTFTGCSIASIFTGLNPHHHGLYWGSLTKGEVVSAHALSPVHFTLAERLAERGYRTASWFQNRMLREELGFGQGFEVYQEIRGEKSDGSRRIIDSYLAWLADRPDETPTFAYLHVLDLHDPYDPRPPFDAMFQGPAAVAPDYDASAPDGWRSWLQQVKRGEREVSAAELEWITAHYDGAIASIDRQVGRLVDGLNQLGRYQDTLIVLTADHGDGFGEHGFLGHTNSPYDELVHVPLILKLPDARAAGSMLPFQVRLIDILPTMMEMAIGGESDVLEELDGCSLLPLLTAGSEDPRPERCREAVSEILLGGERLVVAVREQGMTYLMGESVSPALFDQTSDPHEQRNLAGRGLPTEARLRRRALEVLAAGRTLDGESHLVGSETLEEIRALGYVE